MEPLNICHFTPLPRAPHTITHTHTLQVLFPSLAGLPNSREFFPFCGRVTGNVDTTPGSSEIRKNRKRVLHDFSLAPVQPSSSYSAALCRCRQGSSSLSRRGLAVFLLLLLLFWMENSAGGRLWIRWHHHTKVLFIYFLERNFPPLWTICESNGGNKRGKNRDLYFFRRSRSGTAGAERGQGSTSSRTLFREVLHVAK